MKDSRFKQVGGNHKTFCHACGDLVPSNQPRWIISRFPDGSNKGGVRRVWFCDKHGPEAEARAISVSFKPKVSVGEKAWEERAKRFFDD